MAHRIRQLRKDHEKCVNYLNSIINDQALQIRAMKQKIQSLEDTGGRDAAIVVRKSKIRGRTYAFQAVMDFEYLRGCVFSHMDNRFSDGSIAIHEIVRSMESAVRKLVQDEILYMTKEQV